jgi:hypothetical protein
MARQALKCCGEECEDLRILPRRINYFEAKEIVGNGQSLLPPSASQPAASGAGQGFIGLLSVPMPPGSQQGCIAQKLQQAVAVQGAPHVIKPD